MKKFEHFIFWTGNDWIYNGEEYTDLISILNAIGSDGWELVAIEPKRSIGDLNSPFAFYFKREL